MTTQDECERVRREAEERLWRLTQPTSVKRKHCKSCKGSGMDGPCICVKCGGTGNRQPKPRAAETDNDLRNRLTVERRKAAYNDDRLKLLREKRHQ
jgi:hypothetical protein